jgi:hypothetical protein
MIAFKHFISIVLLFLVVLFCWASYSDYIVCVVCTLPKYIISCNLFTFIYTYICAVCTFLGGGGRTSTYFPAEELRVSVLSVQCVASTCVSVGMG